MNIIAIDPGTEKSAILRWDGKTVWDARIAANDDVLAMLYHPPANALLAIEMVACYGMAVGKDTFETVVWVGRFIQRAQDQLVPHRKVYRLQVKMHHCHDSRAKDANIRQALIDKYGPPGTKKAPGLTYGISSHLWAAFAVATFITESEKIAQQQPNLIAV